MTLSNIVSFDDGGNFIFNPVEIEFTGSKAQLKLGDNPGQAFNQPFDSDTGFTYDSALAEFVAGAVRQKDRRPANATFGATFTSSIDGNWGGGVLTGTATGGAVISGGKLDLRGGTNKYVDYAALGNADGQQVGCIKFQYTPNYTGIPAAQQDIINIDRGDGTIKNWIFLFHGITKGIYIYVYNSAGAAIIDGVNLGTWDVVAGTTYEIELNYDIVTGATRVFVDGVQFGATQTQTGTRDANIGLFRIGAHSSGAGNPNFQVDNLEVFSTVQHTANYTPGYTLPETVYAASKVELPQFAYPGAGALQDFSSFATTEASAPRYVLNDLWWDGAAWVASSGAYSQANSKADVLANIATLPASDTLNVDIVFDNSSTQSSVDDLTTTYTGQTYPITNPVIVQNSGLNVDALLTFISTLTEAGADGVKFHLGIDGISKYWDGAAWVTSDESYAQSNSAAEINTNATSLDIALGVSLKIHTVLHSDDGTTTPDITDITSTYNAYFPPPAEPDKCTVYGYLRTLTGETTFTNGRIKVISSTRIILPSGFFLLPKIEYADINADGYFEIDLVQTALTQDTMIFSAQFNGLSKPLGSAIIPATGSANLAEILIS